MSENCTLFLAPLNGSGTLPDVNELKRSLENGSEEVKIEAMKSVLAMLSSGSSTVNSLLMTIIRFVMPNQKNKLLKKLVLLYFEMIPKVDGEGRLLSEMILVCNALRSELEHPNEYVRGVTLRFLCRIKEAEIIEPLDRSIRLCLEHRHPYVRKNAIMAIFSIFNLGNDTLFPDAPELIHTVLVSENDPGCQRNAFIALSRMDPRAAAEFLSELSSEQVNRFDPLMQLAMIEFFLSYSAFLALPSGESSLENPLNVEEFVKKCVKSLGALLQSSTNASEVKFEAAGALMQLSSSPSAVRAVVSCYVELAVKEADNNAKLMVLDKLSFLQSKHAAVVNENILEVLRVLSASDLAVRTRALEVILAGVNSRLAPDLVSFLVKEISRQTNYDHAKEYRSKILSTIAACALRFPPVAPEALKCYLYLLCERETFDSSLTQDAIRFVRGVIERGTASKKEALEAFLEALPFIADSDCMCSLIWTLGEFARGEEMTQKVMAAVQQSLGKLPIVDSELAKRQAEEEADSDEAYQATLLAKSPSAPSKRKINLDGTYASENAFTSGSSSANSEYESERIRKFVLSSDYSVGVAMASAVTKIALAASPKAMGKVTNIKGEAMLYITSALRVGMSPLVSERIDKDSYQRMMTCIRILAQTDATTDAAFTRDCHTAFERQLKLFERSRSGDAFSQDSHPIENGLSFRLAHLTTSGCAKGSMVTVDPDAISNSKDVSLALLGESVADESRQFSSLLSRVTQLTGFSDCIYAETYVTISGQDILLDILLVNQMDETLQNVSIELSCSGDLKVNDKPRVLTLPSNGFAVAKASVKIRSTDNGVIFGCITYGITQVETIMLSTIPIDIIEYIRPKAISTEEFRRNWTLLEWENKILVPGIPKLSLREVIDALIKDLHFACVTPSFGISENGEYLAANLYATSLFGEEILANICLERISEAVDAPVVSGHLRLRSKTQGIAVALGERITALVAKLG